MSERHVEVSELKELTQMLLKLLEAAERLPEGPERQSFLRTIDDFQRRLQRLSAQIPG
jgi:hypothetical protein